GGLEAGFNLDSVNSRIRLERLPDVDLRAFLLKEGYNFSCRALTKIIHVGFVRKTEGCDSLTVQDFCSAARARFNSLGLEESLFDLFEDKMWLSIVDLAGMIDQGRELRR